MKKFIIGILFFIPQFIFPQTLDQQIRSAIESGQLPTEVIGQLTNTNSLGSLNQSQFFAEAPGGISSLFITPDLIEEVNMGNLTVFYPKGYGRTILHYGIWNAIPFVVFDNSSLELRFGLIFEHRQVGFVPDDWVSTSLTGEGLPDISFLIPKSKTFLSFAHGSSQWRATVLLTENQINDLKQYADSSENVFTVSQRFTDSSVRPYLIGLRNKSYFKIMLQIYDHISALPLVKKFRSTDAFPAGAFFEELVIRNVTEDEVDVQEGTVEVVDDNPGYYYEEYTDTEIQDGEYYDDYNYDDYDDYGYDDYGYDDYYY